MTRVLVALWFSALGYAVRLDVQECDSRCQETFTDCMDRCAGEGPCQEGCRGALTSCVAKCQAEHHPPTVPSARSN